MLFSMRLHNEHPVKPRHGRFLTCLALSMLASLGFSSAAFAQMKVGTNPNTLATDANLQVEASDGKQVLIRKSNGQVGIGTATPGNRLEVDSGTAGASGVRLSQLPSAALLATNASGDIISTTTACTCGEVKQAIVTLPAPWRLLDGTAAGANSCGLGTLPNATGAVLVQGGSAGTTSAATALVPNQLPNVAPTVTINAASAGTPAGTVAVANATSSMQSAGSHTHTYRRTDPAGEIVSGGTGAVAVGNENSNIVNTTDAAGAHTHTMNAHNHSATFTGTAMANHSHTATASSINGGVTPSPLTADNLPRLIVNNYVCVN